MFSQPVIHEISSLDALNQSNATWKRSLFDVDETQEVLMRAQGSWVDVRDVAEGHVQAALHEQAGGQRFIVSHGEHVLQDWCTFRPRRWSLTRLLTLWLS